MLQERLFENAHLILPGAPHVRQEEVKLAAFRELGRALGMFIDKQASIQVSYADELESLQDEIQAAIDQSQAKRAVND